MSPTRTLVKGSGPNSPDVAIHSGADAARSEKVNNDKDLHVKTSDTVTVSSALRTEEISVVHTTADSEGATTAPWHDKNDAALALSLQLGEEGLGEAPKETNPLLSPDMKIPEAPFAEHNIPPSCVRLQQEEQERILERACCAEDLTQILHQASKTAATMASASAATTELPPPESYDSLGDGDRQNKNSMLAEHDTLALRLQQEEEDVVVEARKSHNVANAAKKMDLQSTSSDETYLAGLMISDPHMDGGDQNGQNEMSDDGDTKKALSLHHQQQQEDEEEDPKLPGTATTCGSAIFPARIPDASSDCMGSFKHCKNSTCENDAALAWMLQQQEDQGIMDPITQVGSEHELEGLDDSEDARLAWTLQQEEYGDASSPLVASSIKDETEEAATSMLKTEEIDTDEAMAILQATNEADCAMGSAFSGKAWQFVSIVVEAQTEMNEEMADDVATSTCRLEPVAVDDMVDMAERMLEAQAVYGLENKPTHVDIGYHYTNSANLERIQTNGLLSRIERSEKGVESDRYNGSVYGDGIYTANNPYSHKGYGDVGLLVARLKGRTAQAGRRHRHRDGACYEDHDTGTAHTGSESEMVILRSSFQCVPLARFPQSSICPVRTLNDASASHKIVYEFHRRLQHIVDNFFNSGQPPTVVQEAQPPTAIARPATWTAQPPTAIARPATWTAQPPTSISRPATWAAQPPATAPRPSTWTAHTPGAFPIPADWTAQPPAAISRPAVWMAAPSFTLCPERSSRVVSWKQAPPLKPKLESSPFSSATYKYNAPESLKVGTSASAALPLGESTKPQPQGEMPSGTMRISHYGSNVLASRIGEKTYGTVILVYSIPSGVQKSYHPSPGHEHCSTQRLAFVPDDHEGTQLIKRLVCAFCRGLTFVIDDKGHCPPGEKDHVVWSSTIPHKTSVYDSYPDPEYILQCNQALDKLGIPPAECCDCRQHLVVDRKQEKEVEALSSSRNLKPSP